MKNVKFNNNIEILRYLSREYNNNTQHIHSNFGYCYVRHISENIDTPPYSAPEPPPDFSE